MRSFQFTGDPYILLPNHSRRVAEAIIANNNTGYRKLLAKNMYSVNV